MKVFSRDSEAVTVLNYRSRVRDLFAFTSESQLFQQIGQAKKSALFQDKSSIQNEKKDFARFLSNELASVIPKELRNEEELKKSWKKMLGVHKASGNLKNKKSKKNQEKKQKEDEEDSLDIYEEKDESEKSADGDVASLIAAILKDETSTKWTRTRPRTRSTTKT